VIISIKETKRAMQNINKTKSLLFEKTEMIDKTLPNLTKRENKISDEKWGGILKTNTNEFQRIIGEVFENRYSNNL
jgi:hypothetical protein